MDGQNWRRLERIAFGLTWNTVDPTIFEVYLNCYKKVLFMTPGCYGAVIFKIRADNYKKETDHLKTP